MTATTTAPTVRVGNFHVYKTGAATFVLRSLDGETVGTFPTARKATDHALALVTAAYKASKRA